MGRVVDVDDLVSAEDIAAHYGITRQAVDLWTRKPGFPEPTLMQGKNRIWVLGDVTAWRDAQPPPRAPVGHGTKTRYNAGCRCELCRAANAADHRQRVLSVQLPDGDPRHGTPNGYVNYACRCEPCRAAGSIQNRDRRLRRLAGGGA